MEDRPVELPAGNDAVRAKTGRDWSEWRERLDAAGAARMSHAEIARHLQDVEGVEAWWAQSVTVGYERLTGRRAAGERPDGFSANASKTIRAEAGDAHDAWTSDAIRASWLPADVDVTGGTRPRSVRARKDDAPVDVHFHVPSAGKVRVSVQVARLPDAAAASEQKEFWRNALERLKGHLEGNA